MKTLLDEGQLRDGVHRLAREITSYYENRPLTIVGVLTGSVVLLADLIRQLEMPLQVGLVQARSYRGRSTTPGPLVIHADLLPELKDQHVLLVDDIYDTGRTLFELVAQIDDLGATAVRSAVLFRKRGRQQVSLEPDHVGFEIPNEFVVGYGLDYNDMYRNLPYLASLEPQEVGEEPSV